MSRKEFVEIELTRILNIAKPNLIKCEHIVIDNDEGEICKVHCENGYNYKIDITGDSLAAIVLDIFEAMAYK